MTPAVVAALGVLFAAGGCGGGGAAGGNGGTGGGFTGLGGFGLVDGGGGGGADGGADVMLDPAPPLCGNGIIETGESCDGAARAGCAAGQRCGAGCACVPGPQAPRDSGALIAAALAAGRIDYFTSLLYRAYRLAGDGRLPVEFDGDLTVDEDSLLFLEVSRLWATLTPAQQAQLTPYVARPTDPASVYSTPPTAALFGDSGEELLAADSPPVACPPIAQTLTPDWRYTTGAHFVVWSCGSGDLTTDPYAGKRQAVAAIAEDVWAREVPSMGAPRDDDFPFDPDNKKRIDVYLVPLNRCLYRDAGCGALTSPRTIAAAVPDSPCDNSRGALTSSGYILMRLDLVPDAAPAPGATAPVKARSDFAHEFFHILTYGLNLEAQGGACANTKYTGVRGKTSWLTEASATWAEWAYTPTDNPEYREAQFSGYQKRYPSSDSLLDNHLGRDDNPAYQAFVYPLFLSQESGGRAGFEGFWKGASGARTPAALDDVLDSRVPFDPHFRDFAVKMFNTTLPGDPIAPLLSAFDDAVPADFPPLNPAPDVMLPALVTDWPFHVALAPAAAQVQRFTFAESTNWVEFDVTGAGADLRVDAIVNVNGTWSRRRTNGQRFSFCREDAADDVSELYLILSNTGHAAGAKIDKDYKVRTRVACPSSYTGWIKSERLVTSHVMFDGDTTDEYERFSETWTLGAESTIFRGPDSVPAVDVSWSATYETHDSTVTRLNGPCQSQPVLQTQDGSGSGSGMSQLAITEVPGGVVYLSATGGAVGTFNAPLTYYLQTCDGITQTNEDDDNRISEQLALVSTFLVLMPEAGSPGRYRGSHVVAHQETPRTGGSDYLDWVVTWDVVRNRR